MNEEKTLLEVDTIPYLKQYDIPYPEHGIASSVEEAVTQAEKISQQNPIHLLMERQLTIPSLSCLTLTGPYRQTALMDGIDLI